MDENRKEGKESRGFSLKIRGRKGGDYVRAVKEAAFGNGRMTGNRSLGDKFAEYYEAHFGRLFGMSSRERAYSYEDKRLGDSNAMINNGILSVKEGPAERVLGDASGGDFGEERPATYAPEEPKKSRRGIARFLLGGSKKDVAEVPASKDVIEVSVSEDGIEGSFLNSRGSVGGFSNAMSGYGSESEKSSSKSVVLRAVVGLKGLMKKIDGGKAQQPVVSDCNIDGISKKSRFRALKNLLKKRNKVSESAIVIEGERRSLSHLKEAGLCVAAVCACVCAMAIVLEVYKTNKVGAPAYIACVLATIIGVAAAVAVLRYCVPRVVDKTKTQSSSGKKGRSIVEKDCLFWVVGFGNMAAMRHVYLQAKKMAAKNVPTKHLGFNNNGKLLFRGIGVPEKVCQTFTLFGNKCNEIVESGEYVISRIQFQDPNSMAFLRKMRSAIGEDLRDCLTFRTLKVDVKSMYRFSACFKYSFGDRESYVRFALAMAQAGCSELLIAYLSSFMPKVSYARGERCEGLSLRFMKTKEWKLLCFDEARFGLLSKISTYCKKGIIEDQKKFLKCFLDAYDKHVPASSKQALKEQNSIDGISWGRGKKGSNFPFCNPRYLLALKGAAQGCGARLEEDVNTKCRTFVKDGNMQFGFANAIFVKGGTIDCVYDYSDKYCAQETIDTYLSNMRKEQVYKGWCRS